VDFDITDQIGFQLALEYVIRKTPKRLGETGIEWNTCAPLARRPLCCDTVK